MDNKPFRKSTPKRRKRTVTNYLNHKNEIAEDFNNRCGYCDAHDRWLGGEYEFQIDHFIPKTKYPNFEHVYSNLVYACPYCNRSKWDDWPSGCEDKSFIDDKGYIDPCDCQYDAKFFRNHIGKIGYQGDLGKYMYERMKFYLTRHSLLWIVDELHELKNKLHEIRRQTPNRSAEIAEKIADLDESFQAYYNRLHGTLKRNVTK